MDRTKIRAIAAGAALMMTAMLAVPGFSATSPGSITIRVPDSFQRDAIGVAWSYKAGTIVKSTSLVDVIATADGAAWKTVASRVAIGKGTYLWNVSQSSSWNDAVYAVRLRISGTSTYSGTDYAYVDHTAPTVEITRPSRGEVLVDDTSVAAVDAVVAGKTTLKAAASDALSGVQSVVWQLDGVVVATGATAVYDFTASLGLKELTSVATDAAGNSATATMTVLALPGQSAATVPDGLVPSPDPTTLPSPDPSSIPTPDPTTLPTLPPIPPTPIPSPDTIVPTSSPSPLPTLPPIPPTPLPA